METTTVYIWGRHDKTGHVSIGLEKDYLSLHPLKKNYLDEIAGTRGYLGKKHEDYDNHRVPTATIEINWLDTNAMYSKLDYYHYLEIKKALTYNLLTNNCSTLAIELLCCGAHRDFNPHKSLGQLFSVYKNRITDRETHSRFVESVRNKLEDFMVRCPKGNNKGSMSRFFLPLLTFDFITREFIYTPGDVMVFAKELGKANH